MQTKRASVEDEPNWEPGAEGDLIPTDIGPLPADLWRLVGQEPPRQRPSEQAQVVAAAPAMTDAVPGSQVEPPPHAQAIPSTLVQPSGDEVQGPWPPVVQRAKTPEATAGVGGLPAGPPPAQVVTEESAPVQPDIMAEMDTGELARRVYAEIRRRLLVEAERLRWRS